VASAREKTSSHQIVLQLKLSDSTIQECKNLRDQFHKAKEGSLQFTNPDVFTFVIAKTSLTEKESTTVQEILAKLQEKPLQDLKIGDTDCEEGDQVQLKHLNIPLNLFRYPRSVPGSWTRSTGCRLWSMI
jgi:hypothetical protein